MSAGESGPRVRPEGLMVEPMGEELLVYDERSNRAHSLNAAAAAVFGACDGTRSRERIAAQCGLDQEAADLALADLSKADLLLDYTAPPERVSRRAVIRRLAVAGAGLGVAVPVVRSIVAPTGAMAASSGGKGKGNAGHACTNSLQCASTSLCNSSLHSCQRGYSASCSHTSSCEHNAGGVVIACRSGHCVGCNHENSACPSGTVCGSSGFYCVPG